MTTTIGSPPDTAKAPERSASSLVDAVFRAREISIAGALVLLILGTYLANPLFLSDQGVKDLLLNASILVLLAVGQSAVVITRNIDLSVGSVVGLSAFACGKFVAGTDHGVLTVMLLGIAIGVVCGLVSGALVSFGRVPALVVTLGMLYIIQGIDYWWAQGEQISASDVPEAVLGLGSGSVLGVPYLPLIALVLLAATAYFLRGYRSGRELYAIGSSPEAARLAGIPIRRRVLAAYAFSGAVAGFAGALWLARFGTVVADNAHGWELTVVSAVVVGGVAITGGTGTVWGAALGALLLTTIGSVLVVLKVDSFWQGAITGALLLLAISVDRIVNLRMTAALRKRNARHDHGA
ncbi:MULTISPECIES: ABC transporter permease [Streptomyces]|uniref:Autoinducer 2 import system permease protein LsrC n=1 Tax=Streptomyces glycanivorans TaxID=3033808 RepID=A0ABY9JFA0_9ACTN|nr:MULTISPECIES: ABC transporter permease [unclassified Streptomyces]WSQ79842.1 ABC transporter permease [Streptomyces sp. NBC_01213]TXS15689.1 ABC transporter permease [Streptomyces sp. wa22]WLQ66390.1 ABC transporter permease [Streptomyces sp. Alt3]WSQ87221.1 ABC transporter permease [Streptomyces sp. NBC_01212]WSR06763.1 ABC transporter permease [Streptomyces sp. NBC_01208]